VTHTVDVAIASSVFNATTLRSSLSHSEQGIRSSGQSHIADVIFLEVSYKRSMLIDTMFHGTLPFYWTASLGASHVSRLYSFSYRSESATFGEGYDDFAWETRLPLSLGIEACWNVGPLQLWASLDACIAALATRPPYAGALTPEGAGTSAALKQLRFAWLGNLQLFGSALACNYPVSTNLDGQIIGYFEYSNDLQMHRSTTLLTAGGLRLLWRL
jgi:hypothetical protein